jgi:hypothetical protein
LSPPSSSDSAVGKIPWPFVLWRLYKGPRAVTSSEEAKSNDRVFIDERLNADEANRGKTTVIVVVEAAPS